MIDMIIHAISFPDWISDTAIPITDNFGIKWYGISYVVGIGLAYYWALRTSRKQELWIPSGITRGSDIIPNKIQLEDFAFYCFLGIFVGGRLGFVILYDLEDYLANPIEIFKVWKGGMAFHGGFAGVCVAAWFITRKYKVSLWRWADMAAIGAPLGIMCVRLANFANQELYGRVTDVPWAFVFDEGPHVMAQPRHPSQLYEAALEGVAIFVIIWFFTRKKKILTKPGIAAGLFFLLYGCFRIFVEFFRMPDAPLFGPFTRGMSYSIPMVIIGICIVIWASRRPPVAPKRIAEETK